MPRNRYALPALSALAVSIAITFSAAVAQTPVSPPTRNRTQANSGTLGTPPVRASGGVPVSTVPGTHPTHGTIGRREPCWQVAGVSKAAMEQRRVIGQQSRQEVESVCANASLSPAQKQERIREIHQQEHQQMDALISPQQREAMHACQQERGGGVRVGGGHAGGGHGSGPCGTLPGVARRMNETETDEGIPKD
jgi:hypothetical protein